MTSSPESGSNNVYVYVDVVLENYELYPRLYSTYEAARAAVLHKHAATLEEQRRECADMMCSMCSDVDVVQENKETGTTKTFMWRRRCTSLYNGTR